MPAPSAIDPVMQRGTADCAIAALAMLSGRPYREVSEAAMAISPVVHRSGLWNTELGKIARAIGFRLRPVRKISTDPDTTGLLVLKRRTNSDGHVVVLFQGVVVDPASGLIWDLDTYLEHGRWSVRSLLEPAE